MSAPSPGDAKILLAVVAQNTAGASFLFFVALLATDTGQQAFHKISKEYDFAIVTVCKESWLRRLVTKVVVGSAEIQWVCDHALSCSREKLK